MLPSRKTGKWWGCRTPGYQGAPLTKLGSPQGRFHLFYPMPGYLLSGSDPDIVETRYVLEEPAQSDDPPGPADYPAVRPYRHHLGGRGGLAAQDVEGILQVVEEIGRCGEPVHRRHEMEIVGVRGVGQNQDAVSVVPVGEVVVIR